MSLEYLVVIEEADDGTFSAYAPDLPGCVSSGDSVEALKDSIREAIRLHVESLRDLGEEVPQPRATAFTTSMI